ncbi:MAG: 16S rRNA (guanine(527)-N(7))-methyltransferase RsmG [Bacteroidales bacterium]
MNDTAIITKYFPGLSEKQLEQFARLSSVYRYWNDRINVISRRDIDHLYERHVLHSLAIAKAAGFGPGLEVLDVGTGGGFPGIPLAILFPDVKFHLVDSIGKKIHVVNEVVRDTGLQNVSASQARAEALQDRYDIIVSRAVTRLDRFTGWIGKRLKKTSGPASTFKTGIFYLKGGDISGELPGKNWKHQILPVSEWFEEPFFQTKYVVHLWK